MQILPFVAVALLGTALPLAAQTPTRPVPMVRTEVSPIRTRSMKRFPTPTRSTGPRRRRTCAQGDGYDRMTVPVRVSGHGPYRFLIDTGADHGDFVRSRTTAPARRPQGDHSPQRDSESQIQTANVPMLDMTAKQVRNLDAALLEFGAYGRRRDPGPRLAPLAASSRFRSRR